VANGTDEGRPETVKDGESEKRRHGNHLRTVNAWSG